MDARWIQDRLTPVALARVFPPERTERFFEALFGDAGEGAYDIRLSYRGQADGELELALELHQRPGKCLACNLTHGLPQVFGRHPVIDVAGLVRDVDALLGEDLRCGAWHLGSTRELRRGLHAVPLFIRLEAAT